MDRALKCFFALAVPALTLFLSGCHGSTAIRPDEQKALVPRADAAPHEVSIDNFTFSPAELTVSAGSTVVWINHDDVPHTATSKIAPPLFDSGALDTDQRFAYVFTKAGTYDYFCAVHPHMTGKIIVK